ncbi:MAG: hypothetical protein HY319_22795 [Armatimonadetes bacterium]|nr:hypothetical protein [Armatimonadota bacterium]
MFSELAGLGQSTLRKYHDLRSLVRSADGTSLDRNPDPGRVTLTRDKVEISGQLTNDSWLQVSELENEPGPELEFRRLSFEELPRAGALVVHMTEVAKKDRMFTDVAMTLNPVTGIITELTREEYSLHDVP